MMGRLRRVGFDRLSLSGVWSTAQDGSTLPSDQAPPTSRFIHQRPLSLSLSKATRGASPGHI